MSREIIDRLIKIEDKVDDALTSISKLDERSLSIDKKVDILHCHNKENISSKFKIIWSILAAFFTYLSALTYQLMK